MFNLNCPDGPLELRELYALASQEGVRLARALETEIFQLCRAWWRIHGQH